MNMLTHGYEVATAVTGIDAVIVKNCEATAQYYKTVNQPEMARFWEGYAKYKTAQHLAPKPNGLSRKQLKRLKREAARQRRLESMMFNEDD